MNMCHHEAVVPLYTSFLHGTTLWLVMQLASLGSCLDLMHHLSPSGFFEHAIRCIIFQVLHGLHYLHASDRLHRDLKAANLLVRADGSVLISDLGVSAWLSADGRRKKKKVTFVGTPCWMAPEVLEQVSGYDCSVDIWSLGITCMELCRGSAPRQDMSPMKVLVAILQDPPPRLEPLKGKISPEFADFVENCLQISPKARPSARECLEHAWMKGLTLEKCRKDLVETLLSGVPPVWERDAVQKLREGVDGSPDAAFEDLAETPPALGGGGGGGAASSTAPAASAASAASTASTASAASAASVNWDFDLSSSDKPKKQRFKVVRSEGGKPLVGSGDADGGGGGGSGSKKRFTVVKEGRAGSEIGSAVKTADDDVMAVVRRNENMLQVLVARQQGEVKELQDKVHALAKENEVLKKELSFFKSK